MDSHRDKTIARNCASCFAFLFLFSGILHGQSGCPSQLNVDGELYCGMTSSHSFHLVATATLNGNNVSGAFTWEKEVGSSWVLQTEDLGELYTPEFTPSTVTRYRVTITFDGPTCAPLSQILNPTFESLPDPPTVTLQEACGPGGSAYVTAHTQGRLYSWYFNSTLIGTETTIVGGVTASNLGNQLRIENLPYTISGFSVSAQTSYCGVPGAPQTAGFSAVVIPLPVVTIGSGIPSVICPESSPIALTMGSPAGGVWKLDNVVLNPQTHLSPPSANTSHTITYTYTEEHGCSNTASTSFQGLYPDYPYYGISYLANYNEPYTITLTPRPSGILPARTFNWYSTETGGTRLATSNSFTTGPILTQTKIYASTAFVANPNCETHRGGLVIEVGGPANYNYVREEIILVPGITNDTITSMSETEKIATTTYLDGLGRPMETVVKRGSPTGNDVITPVFYDHYGRETVRPLPITGGNTGYYQNILNSDGTYKAAVATFYSSVSSARPGIRTDTAPYTDVTYESSPLNRVLKTVAPGSALRNGSTPIGVTKTYQANFGTFETGYPSIHLFRYNVETGSITVESGIKGFYRDNELSMVATTDEDNRFVLEFTDRRGRLVCKKVQIGSTYASTYYLYDDFGNLAVVLPPEAVAQLVSAN